MDRRTILVLSSLAAHAALAAFIGEIEVKKSHAATAIAYAEAHKKKPPEPTHVDPTPPPEKPASARPLARRSAAPPPPAAPEAAKPQTTAPLEALPDFGLSLGSASGTGVALPAGGGSRPSAAPSEKLVVKKKLGLASAPAPALECDEPASKPRPLNVPQPPYTDQARAAQIQGKVRVQITVDETGKVIDVKLLAGLGYGLDEVALAAARAASFEPAQQCGKPVRATFNIGMRFTL